MICIMYALFQWFQWLEAATEKMFLTFENIKRSSL